MKRVLLIFFVTVAGLTLILVGLGRSSYADHRAQTLRAQAKTLTKSNPEAAIADLEVASNLAHDRRPILMELANLYQETGRLPQAIKTLRRLPVGETGERTAQLQLENLDYPGCIQTTLKINTSRAKELQAKCWLEQNRGAEAQAAAKDSGNSYLVGLMRLSLNNGSVPADGSTVETRVEAAKKLAGLRASQTALAQALYAEGLLNSSEKILESSKEESAQKYLLLARINWLIDLRQTKPTSGVKTNLSKGLELDPGNLQLRQLLQSLEASQSSQAELIKQLQPQF